MEIKKSNKKTSTCYSGYSMETSVEILKKILGEPTKEEREFYDKVQFLWNIEIDGVYLTVYDWKEYRRYYETEVITFNIGWETEGTPNRVEKIKLLQDEVEKLTKETIKETKLVEEFVYLPIAIMLKEKGFNEYCFAYYSTDNDSFEFELPGGGVLNYNLNENCFATPTIQMVLKYLREIHHVCITIYPFVDTNTKQCTWDILITKTDGEENPFGDGSDIKEIFYDFEEAAQFAIKYVLEKL